MAFGIAQTGEFLPTLAGVGGAEDCRVFNAGEDGVRIIQGRFEVPDALEFPRMLRTVIPFVGADGPFINKFIVYGFPSLAAVVRTLNQLAEPAAALRGV